MAERYVRAKTTTGQCIYGIFEPNRSLTVLTDAPWMGGRSTGISVSSDSYTLLAPCSPSKIIAVGRNYAAHAAEMGSELPSEPIIFLKPPTTLLAPDGMILIPPQSRQVDYEGELALVIGKTCFDLSPAEALSTIWGYTIANDVTARDLQKNDPQWTRSKSFDTFCPLGPWVVREISPSALLQTRIDRLPAPVQNATIDQMNFSPEVLVSYISQVMTLLPGDVILTGTPDGIGTLHSGDRVTVEIEGIGKLSNSVGERIPPAIAEP